ncbi:MAG: thioesterase [Bacteroidales bacterium]|nr:thioesterase [Bacteroidales bacterium]
MQYPIHHEQIVITHELTNASGTLKEGAMSQFLSDVAIGHTKILGVDMDAMSKIGLTWMLHSIHLTINQWPHINDTLEIDTFPSGLDRLFALRCYEIKNSQGNQIAKASSRWMQIDVSRRRPVRPTPAIVTLNAGLQLPQDMPIGDLVTTEMPQDMKEATHYIASDSDIDFNGHVTQATYLQWLANTMSKTYNDKYRLAEAQVIYMREILPGNTILSLIKEEKTDNGIKVYHKLMSEDHQITHCIGLTIWQS